MTTTPAPSAAGASVAPGPHAPHRKSDPVSPILFQSVLEDMSSSQQVLADRKPPAGHSGSKHGSQDDAGEDVRAAREQLSWQSAQLQPMNYVASSPPTAATTTREGTAFAGQASDPQGDVLKKADLFRAIAVATDGLAPSGEEPTTPNATPVSRTGAQGSKGGPQPGDSKVRTHSSHAFEPPELDCSTLQLQPSDESDGDNRGSDGKAVVHLSLSESSSPDQRSTAVLQPSPEGTKIPSPARQIMQCLETSTASGQMPITPLMTALPQAQDVKVLRMKLRPDALGDVELSLRRNTNEMHIHITVTKRSTADMLQGEIAALRDRIDSLLPAETTHTITISVVTQDGSPLSNAAGSMPGEPGTLDAGQGSLGSAGGDRSTPHKEERPLQQREWAGHDRDTPLQSSADGGLVV